MTRFAARDERPTTPHLHLSDPTPTAKFFSAIAAVRIAACPCAPLTLDNGCLLGPRPSPLRPVLTSHEWCRALACVVPEVLGRRRHW